MKIVKNISMQGLNIPFGTPEGVKNIFLAPKQKVEVPDSWRSAVSENLVHRRMVKVVLTADPAVALATPTSIRQIKKNP